MKANKKEKKRTNKKKERKTRSTGGKRLRMRSEYDLREGRRKMRAINKCDLLFVPHACGKRATCKE